MKTPILMIEDDPALRETTSAFLETEGFKVQAASDGEKGLAMALGGRPALVLLDVMLPGMSGFEVCKLLREKGCAVPVILLTGQKTDEVDKVLGLGLGADDYLLKRETILNEVWGYETFPTTRTIDTFVHALRRKIEKDPSRPIHLLTVPWMGYKFKK